MGAPGGPGTRIAHRNNSLKARTAGDATANGIRTRVVSWADARVHVTSEGVRPPLG